MQSLKIQVANNCSSLQALRVCLKNDGMMLLHTSEQYGTETVQVRRRCR